MSWIFQPLTPGAMLLLSGVVTLSATDSQQTQASDTAALTQHHVVSVSDSAQAQSSDTVALTQHSILSVADSAQVQASDTVGLTQHYNLAVSDSSQLQASDPVTVTVGGEVVEPPVTSGGSGPSYSTPTKKKNSRINQLQQQRLADETDQEMFDAIMAIILSGVLEECH